MWWIETTGYHLGGLIWLIAVAVTFVIALVAVIMAASAISKANTAQRLASERAVYETAPRREDAVNVSATDAALAESVRVLHDRYARGEISRDEYLQRREDLTRAETGILNNERPLQSQPLAGEPERRMPDLPGDREREHLLRR